MSLREGRLSVYFGFGFRLEHFLLDCWDCFHIILLSFCLQILFSLFLFSSYGCFPTVSTRSLITIDLVNRLFVLIRVYRCVCVSLFFR